MKKVFLSVIALLLTTFIFAQSKIDAVAKFNAEVIDLGKVEQGNPATATFVVKNVGTTPLLIESAQPTCGCTIGDYTKEPIMPGKEGKITATYNAANAGPFSKTMNVKFAGIDENKSFTLRGEVLTADDYAKQPKKTETTTEVKVKNDGEKVKTKAKAKS